jgi:hypothetical protein
MRRAFTPIEALFDMRQVEDVPAGFSLSTRANRFRNEPTDKESFIERRVLSPHKRGVELLPVVVNIHRIQRRSRFAVEWTSFGRLTRKTTVGTFP